MNKFDRMLDVLDLYSGTDALLTAEDIAARLGVSRPTAFRYVRELSRSGFLANYSGRYSLGARIIALDRRARESDPVLTAARDIMRDLAGESACSVGLGRMYNDEIVNIHLESGPDPGDITFGRGRLLPLFRGSISKAMVAHLSTPRLRRLFEQHRHEPDAVAIATEWPHFRAYFARIRSAGHYVSIGELDADMVGIAAPILVPGAGAVAALTIVFTRSRLRLLNTDGHAAFVAEKAALIATRLAGLGEGTR